MAESAASSSSLDGSPVAQEQTQQPAGATGTAQNETLSPGELSVQARIRARRAQRRAQAIHDTYSHLYEAYLGMDYQRFIPGPNKQRVTMYAWDTALTRYYNERLGVTVDGRGYYGTPYVGLNPSSITRPAISQYDILAGPVYRFYLHPKYSIAGRVMGGTSHGNFSGDTNGFGGQALGMYPDGWTYAFNASLLGEVNVSPNLSVRLGGEYMGTGFGSTLQNSRGFTFGFVYRFGKQ